VVVAGFFLGGVNFISYTFLRGLKWYYLVIYRLVSCWMKHLPFWGAIGGYGLPIAPLVAVAVVWEARGLL